MKREIIKEDATAISPCRINHLAVIPDGNRRWARSKGLQEEEGHKRGFLEVTPCWLREAWREGINTITLWLFSTENWKRSRHEVDLLMGIYEAFIRKMLPIVREFSVRMIHLGRKDRIPGSLLETIGAVEKQTACFEKHLFNFALDYGGRDEIIRMVNSFLKEPPKDHVIAEQLIEKYLDTKIAKYNCPDIVIRTSGVVRTSGFMPWQSAYSEHFFIDKFYPDFCWEDVKQIIHSFSLRSRRYGQ